MLDPETEYIVFWHILSLNLFLELETMSISMRVSSKCLNDGLLVFLLILLIIAATMTITVFVTIHLLLEALAIKFEAPRSFAVAAQLFLFRGHLLLLLIYLRDYYDVPGTAVASLRKRGGGIPNSMGHWKAFFKLFLEGFPKGLRVDRVLCLIFHLSSLWVLPRRVILDRRRDKSIIRARAIEYFSKIGPSIKSFGWARMCRFLYPLDLHRPVS